MLVTLTSTLQLKVLEVDHPEGMIGDPATMKEKISYVRIGAETLHANYHYERHTNGTKYTILLAVYFKGTSRTTIDPIPSFCDNSGKKVTSALLT